MEFPTLYLTQTQDPTESYQETQIQAQARKQDLEHNKGPQKSPIPRVKIDVVLHQFEET